MESDIIRLLTNMVREVAASITHNWLPLSFAIVTAAVMKAYIDPEKLKRALLRKTKVSIVASVAVGAFTPLCACGTMGVIIGMLTTALPWGPIMAFLTSSPLMSPDGFILVSGIISMKFAVALAVASIVIGLGSGFITHLIETKTSFLKNQSRFNDKEKKPSCACAAPVPSALTQSSQCGCGINPADVESSEKSICLGNTIISVPALSFGMGIPGVDVDIPNSLFCFFKRIKIREIFNGIVNVGLKQILLYFAIFVAVGYLINYFIPSSLIIKLFGGQNYTSVPLAALIGLPLYVSGESALPLIKALMKSGASDGSMLAFLITGPGTSAWVITGIAVFMKRKVIALYVGFLLFGGILLGYLYDLMLMGGPKN
jgi:uncharacterized membrane protein YraQ (UPF0718 family)